MLTYLVAFGLSAIVAMLVTPLVTRLAHKHGWLDQPTEARKVHVLPIPRLGGLAVVTAFFTPLFGLAIYTNRISGLLYAETQLVCALCIGAAAIVMLGIYDDVRGADAKLKLTVQSLVAIGMWFAGFRIELLGTPFAGTLTLGALSLPLTVLWVVGVVNALNLIDGLDGLASGIALFAALVLFGVAFVDNAVLLCLLMAALGGALLGFLFFNFNPARIFLGDSGSMFLGFILAIVSIWTQRKGAAAVALVIPVVALGVPILDTTLSFMRRVSRRQNPFKADKEHLHHRLMALGLSHRGAVFTLYTVSGIFCLGALALLDNDTTRRTIVLATVAAVVIVLVHKIGGLSGPLLFTRGADLVSVRDQLRAAGRSIREARDSERAWTALVSCLPELRCEEIRLSLRDSTNPADAEVRETVYRWRRDDQKAWALDSPKGAARALRLPLEEGGEHFGELALLGSTGNITGDQEVAFQLLREALIDYAVLALPAPAANVDAGRVVVRLAKS